MTQNEESNRRILWVDDEIEFLRAHIFFLEDNGWKVDKATNGHDALAMALRENYDVVLLDEQMAGIDGLTTLQRLKKSNPALFVVMVTKSEEERVMEEAIGRNIDGYLTKPVNPAQIVSLCKSLFNARSLRSNHLTSRYVRQYAENKARILGPVQPADWEQVHQRLCQWDLDLGVSGNEGLRETHAGQREEAETIFLQYLESRWYGWMGRERLKPNFTWDLIAKRFKSKPREEKLPVLLVLSGLRTDHWLAMQPLLEGLFEVKLEHHWSPLPGIPEVARLCLFGGASQKVLAAERPEWKWPAPEKLSDPSFLAGLLARNTGLAATEIDVRVASTVSQSRELAKRSDGLGTARITAIVLEFAQMLQESSSESDSENSANQSEAIRFRTAARMLLAQAGIYHLLRRLQSQGREVILTADVGSTPVTEAIEVFCSEDQPHGFRVQFGKEISCDERHAFFVENPASAGLDGSRGPMALAKGERFFTQPNKYQYYGTSHLGRLVSGGLSMAEVLVPAVHLDPPLIGFSRLETESVTEVLGGRLAAALLPGDMLFLEGELGAGKSTLARAILRAMGWKGIVRSPSYSLVHVYATPRGVVHHMDLYRVHSMDEALGLDLDELSSGRSIGLVEWPDRLGGSIAPTWRAHLELEDDVRRLGLYGPPRSGIEAILANLNQEYDA